MIKYREEQIKNILNLLDNLTIKGIDNSKRVAIISQILNEGVPENEVKQ